MGFNKKSAGLCGLDLWIRIRPGRHETLSQSANRPWSGGAECRSPRLSLENPRDIAVSRRSNSSLNWCDESAGRPRRWAASSWTARSTYSRLSCSTALWPRAKCLTYHGNRQNSALPVPKFVVNSLSMYHFPMQDPRLHSFTSRAGDLHRFLGLQPSMCPSCWREFQSFKCCS